MERPDSTEPAVIDAEATLDDWIPLYELIIESIKEEIPISFFYVEGCLNSEDLKFNLEDKSKFEYKGQSFMQVNVTEQYCHKQYHYIEIPQDSSKKKMGAILVNIDSYPFWVGILYENEKRGMVGDMFYKAVMSGIRHIEQCE